MKGFIGVIVVLVLFVGVDTAYSIDPSFEVCEGITRVSDDPNVPEYHEVTCDGPRTFYRPSESLVLLAKMDNPGDRFRWKLVVNDDFGIYQETYSDYYEYGSDTAQVSFAYDWKDLPVGYYVPHAWLETDGGNAYYLGYSYVNVLIPDNPSNIHVLICGGIDSESNEPDCETYNPDGIYRPGSQSRIDRFEIPLGLEIFALVNATTVNMEHKWIVYFYRGEDKEPTAVYESEWRIPTGYGMDASPFFIPLNINQEGEYRIEAEFVALRYEEYCEYLSTELIVFDDNPVEPGPEPIPVDMKGSMVPIIMLLLN